MFNDLRYAFRQLLKNPGFTAVAVLTLALGIGATTAIFSVVYAVVLRPLPFPESERLVALWTQTPQFDRLPMAAANHRDLKAQNTVFEDIALLSRVGNYNLTGDGEPERLLAARVAANLFPLLRVRPALGRGFTEDENQPGQDHVVILSHGLWQRRYAGDPNIVGKTIRLENVPHTVVGVMSPEFQYPTRDIQIWTPLTINPADFQTRTGYGHLDRGASQTGRHLGTSADRGERRSRRGWRRSILSRTRTLRFSVTPLRRDIAQVARRPLIVLLGAALGLLLIGCCNLVSLLLARALARSRETAVRSALGATQARLIRQAAAELLPILALGSFLGVLAAKAGIELIIPWLPSALPRVEEIEVNLPVLLFSGAILFITAVLVLLLPAMQATMHRSGRNTPRRLTNFIGNGGQGDDSEPARRGPGGADGHSPYRGGIADSNLCRAQGCEPWLSSAGSLESRPGDSTEQVWRGRKGGGVLPTHSGTGARAARGRGRRDGQPASLGGPSGMSSVFFERANQEPGMLEATDDTTSHAGLLPCDGYPGAPGTVIHRTGHDECPLVVVVDERVARLAWPGENPIGKRMRSSPNSAVG